MLQTLKEAGRNIGRELGRTWENLLMERAYGNFQRAIPLPSKVDTDKAEASYKHGVLTVRLPKAGGEKSRLIPVS